MIAILCGIFAGASSFAENCKTDAPADSPTAMCSVTASSDWKSTTGAETLRRASQRQNKVTLVSIWASWCQPCRKEVPALQHLAKKYNAQYLTLEFISVDTDLLAAKKSWSQMKMPGESLIVGEALEKFAKGLASRWDQGIPATFLFNPQSKFSRYWVGSKSLASIAEELDLLISAKQKNTESPSP